jgi:hypothetical protein
MLFLRKSMRPTQRSPYDRCRRTPRGDSKRSANKLKAREVARQAVMAQQAIEAAFRHAGMNWRQVELALKQRGWVFEEIWRLANVMGVEKIANELYLKQAA